MSFFSQAASIAPLSNSEVLIVGPITSSSADNFAVQFNKVLFLLPENKPLTIYLNSEGGSLDSAEDMIKVMQTAKNYGVQIRVVVPHPEHILQLFRRAVAYSKTDDPDSLVMAPSEMPKKALCLSACTLIFAAGSQRVAHKDFIFLFHAPQPSEWLKNVATEKQQQEEAALYSKNWSDTLAKVSPKLVRFLNEEVRVFDKISNEFTASADTIHSAFPDFIQELEN